MNHTFFVGIGGSGMISLATYLCLKGERVSGYDAKIAHAVTELGHLGARILGASDTMLPEDIGLCVFSLAVKDDNPFLVQARERGIPCMTYPEALARTLAGHQVVAVAGTHGKTTTTAMTALALRAAGENPSLVFGGEMIGSGDRAWAGSKDVFVIEACEFKRSFLNYHPKIAVITNIDDDHLDYYGTLEGVEKAFGEFIAQISEEGVLICDPDHETVKPVLPSCKGRIIDFKQYLGSVPELHVFGDHNRRNAACALAVADALHLDSELAKRGLHDFNGTGRRCEELGSSRGGAIIVSDYAHHPTEVEASLHALREKYSDRKIIAVFQPHLYTRFNTLFDRFANALSGFDEVHLMPVFAARDAKPPENCHTVEELVAFLRTRGIPADLYKKTDFPRDSIVAFIGAGSIDEIARSYIL